VEVQAVRSGGIPVNDLFPNVATCVDDLAIVCSMVSNFRAHQRELLLHSATVSGAGQHGRWVTYGPAASADPPGFVVSTAD
jgi:hypothetical protein